MNRKLAKAYICELQLKLKWAAKFVPVCKFEDLDWDSSDQVYKIRFKRLEAEYERLTFTLTELAKELTLLNKQQERAEVTKIMRVLAKYIRKDNGL